ncbi:hypothetical protein DFH06DRAFT_1148272 [Mycena polygramma]|nr:hypothetical protein DFH06DRAFT_1148272 [Mycena polygramma]
MSTPPSDNPARPSDSAAWRSAPPHMSTSTGSDQFVSVASNPAPPTPMRPESATSGERTTSPSQPTGLSATLEVDAQGRRYLREAQTGLRIDIFDEHGELVSPHNYAAEQPQNDTDGPAPSTNVSSESDVTPETRSDGATAVSAPSDTAPGPATPDSMVTTLLESLDLDSLNQGQRSMLQTIQGALLTSRQRLLNTTAVVLDQRSSSFDVHASLASFRDETAVRFSEFDELLQSGHSDLERCIRDNVRVLTELGESEASMSRLLHSMSTTRGHTLSPLAPIPEINPPDVSVLSDRMARDVNGVLPPRRERETNDEFQRRAAQSAASARRAAAAFPLPEARGGPDIPGPIKLTRFEDTGSISSAPRYRPNAPEGISTVSTTGFGVPVSSLGPISGTGKSTFDAMEEFTTETEAHIRSIIHRQVGEELADVPSRIKVPRLSSPSKFTGTNDHQAFIDWVQENVTWMRASFMGGPGPADGYRITVLKTQLSGLALQWFVDYVETRTGASLIPYDFASIICAMHRRFITAATAQKATREFDAVRYKPETGPLKLMDELTDASGRMREPMPDFIIRQKFMRLLPEHIREIMTVHRALSAEYSDIASLRFNANQLWDAYNLRHNLSKAQGSNSGNSPSSSPAASTPRPNANTRREPAKHAAGATTNFERRPPHGQSYSALATQGTQPAPSGPNAHKKCYKCGNLGHIATDKECPKYSDRPRFGAQRIEDGFVEEDHVKGPDDHHEPREVVDDHWGGSQYDPDEAEPLMHGDEDRDLIEFAEVDGARVGAMHWQNYSMRIQPDYEPDVSSSETHQEDSPPERPTTDPLFDYRAPLVRDSVLTETQRLLSELTQNYGRDDERTVDSLYGITSHMDVVSLQDARFRDHEELYTEEELTALRGALVREHDYGVSPYTTYEDAMFHFRLFEDSEQAGSLDEWAAVMTIGAAEHCREEALRVRSLDQGSHRSLSTRTLEYGTQRLIADASEYVQPIQAIRHAQRAANAVLETLQAALDEADVRTNPNSVGRTQALRTVALEMYQDIREDMLALHTSYGHSLRRLESLQSIIVEEIRLRRAEERRLWGSSPEITAGPSEGENPAVAGGADDAATRSSPLHPTEQVTPPPSYYSDSTYNADASPPILEEDDDSPEQDSDSAPGLSSLEWHDVMAAAAATVNSTVNPTTGRSPIDTLTGPPAYAEGSADSRESPDAAQDSAGAGEISLLSRRVVHDSDYLTPGEYLPNEEGSFRRHAWMFQTSVSLVPTPPTAVARSHVGSSAADAAPSPEEVRAESPAHPEVLNEDWWTIPGIHNEPSDPDEPRDARRLWIHGSNADFDNGFVSVLDSLPGPSSSPGPAMIAGDDLPDPQEELMLDEDRVVTDGDEYDLVSFPREEPEPRPEDELVAQSVTPLMGGEGAERRSIYVDHRGTLYTRTSALPDTHYLNPVMLPEHTSAMNQAIVSRASELNCTPYVVRSMLDAALQADGDRGRPCPWRPTMIEIPDEDTYVQLPTLPWDYPLILVAEAALGPNAEVPFATSRPWRPTMIEIPDEDTYGQLPTLPWDYPLILVAEAALGPNAELPFPDVDGEWNEEFDPEIEEDHPEAGHSQGVPQCAVCPDSVSSTR